VRRRNELKLDYDTSYRFKQTAQEDTSLPGHALSESICLEEPSSSLSSPS